MSTQLTKDQQEAFARALGPLAILFGLPYRPTRPVKPIAPRPPVGAPVKVLTVTNPTHSKGADPSGKNGIPLVLNSVAAVQTPVKDQSLVKSAVSVNFTRNPADKNFDHVNIWVTGYHGSSNPVLEAAGNSSPISFILDATQETISVYAQTVSSTGFSAPVSFAAHTTVRLTGTVGKPPAPSISQSLVGTPVGFQFSFNQVSLPANDVEVISVYKIYRGTTNSFSLATVRATLPPDPKAIGAITFADTINDSIGASYYYWVTAVNTAKFESNPTAAQSGAVIGSIGSTPVTLSTSFKIVSTSSQVTVSTGPGAFFSRADGTSTLVGATSQAITGLPSGNTMYIFPYWDESSQTLKFVSNTDFAIPNITGILEAAGSSQYVQTTTGAAIPNTFTVEMWFKGTAAGGLFDFSAPQAIGVGTAVICQCQATSAGEIEFSVFNGAAWANLTTSGASVLDSTWHHVMVAYDKATTTATIIVDGAYSSNGVTFWTSSAMGSISATTGYWHFGAVQGIAAAPLTVNTFLTGSIARVALYNTALTYAEGINHLQAFCNFGETTYDSVVAADGAVNFWELDEPSGTTAADAIGSNTGTYVNAPTLNQTSSVITVLGTPTIAWPYNSLLAMQLQYLRNRVGLSNGGLKAVTPGAGSTTTSGGGSSSGGGVARGGGCFTGKVIVRTPYGDTPLEQLPKEHTFLIENATGIHEALLTVHENYSDDFVQIGPDQYVTVSHLMKKEDKWITADQFYTSEYQRIHLESITVYDISVITNKDEDRHFVIDGGAIAHNIMVTKTF